MSNPSLRNFGKTIAALVITLVRGPLSAAGAVDANDPNAAIGKKPASVAEDIRVVKEGKPRDRFQATLRLGNGNRYGEISRLNAKILEDEDSLLVGTRLKLPVR